ncbi:MAG: hypothetical protein IIU65_04355 [Clostridia bacterium]|nr:hypothetical protein [Clostridia bacterium]
MKYYDDICAEIFEQHEKSQDYKCSLGRKGLFEQSKQNRRFYNGDQWYGAKTGNDKPLVRHNVIKRIGDYKSAVISGEKTEISFSPVCVSTVGLKEEEERIYKDIVGGKIKKFDRISDAEVSLASKAISDYFKTCAKRMQLSNICATALKNAYISGSGVVYAYWDSDIKTGLFADENRKVPIMGDICAEVIDIENVDFSDPELENVQKQEYIIISSRKTVGELIREAKKNGANRDVIENIKPDNEYCDYEAFYSEKATVLTKFFKVYDKNGDFTVKAIRVCRNAVIKPEWDTKLKLYPIAKFNWDSEEHAYGESEITNLIPNQIAINRMLTATVWSVMMMGMPIMVVNGDVVTQPITNSPGQIISFYGNSEDFDRTIKYVSPPQFSGNIDEITNKLIENTLNSAGATDAALGQIRAQNTSAIEAVTAAAKLPLEMIKRRYYCFLEDLAACFLEFMFCMYGSRPLLQKSTNKECWFFPFNSKRYKDFVFLPSVTVQEGKADFDELIKQLEELKDDEKTLIANRIIGIEEKGDLQ